MEIELVPDPGPVDPAARAALVALTREAVDRDVRPAGLDGAWRRAGIDEAVERSPGPNGGGDRRAPGHPGAAPSPVERPVPASGRSRS